MLRRAENVNISYKAGFFTGKGHVFMTIGKKTFQTTTRKIPAAQVSEMGAVQRQFPVRWARIGDRTYYQFQDKFYWDNDDLSPEQVHALLVTRQQAQQRRIDRAQAIVAMDRQPAASPRGHIADDVKTFVWTRDGGKCRNCGSTTELQFDHVIAVAMGGSSEPENLQILCGPCNRRKGAGLTLGTQQASSNPAQPRAGWYPNPTAGQAGQRYWNGSAWTPDVRP